MTFPDDDFSPVARGYGGGVVSGGQSTNLGDLVSLTPTGSLSVRLPISGTLPAPFGNLGTATVVVSDSNVFSGAAPDVSSTGAQCRSARRARTN